MKRKIIKVISVVFCLLTILTATVSAETYTYSIDGTQLYSPDAYIANSQFDAVDMGIEGGLSDSLGDLFVDEKENVYIVDSGNSSVVVMDKFFKFKFSINSFINSNGIEDSLSGCRGCFVTKEYIYVADTNNNRIVIFDLEGNYVRDLEEPNSDIFEDDAFYQPIALAVDATGRIYVVSGSTYQGIMSLNSDGEFEAFVGAQAASYSAFQIFWRQFQTAAQRARSEKIISSEYNNITIDSKGFIYVTTSTIDEANQMASIQDKTATYSPVKKIGAGGDDVLGRNGFFGPGGEVQVNSNSLKSEITGASVIVDVALGPAGSWSIIDQKRSKIYTYDQYGQLLFIFGDKGSMLGNVQKMAAITYKGNDMLVLDTEAKNITLYTRTDYGDTIITALQNEIDRNYDAAVEDYRNILQRNSNFDAAYIGIGKAFYRQGKYSEAMEMFKVAYETTNYSNAFNMQRQQWANKYFIFIPIVVVVILFLITKFFGYAGKVNKSVTTSKGKRTFKQEAMYAFYLIFHPFDGFWDLKHERRGSVRAGIMYIALALLAICYNAVGKAYIFNPKSGSVNIFSTCLSLIVPIVLWVVSNWCLTTLFEGEGSIRDIFVSTSYSLVPLILLMIPATALTNVLTANQSSIYNMLISIGWIWVFMLLFFGTMVTHDYPLMKNLLTMIGSVVGMAFIMFCGVLFSTLIVKMVSFISGIITELSYK